MHLHMHICKCKTIRSLVISNALDKDKDHLTYLFHIFRSGLIINHADSLKDWISNAEKANYLPGMIQKLHSILIESMQNYLARCCLFKILFEIAGFTIQTKCSESKICVISTLKNQMPQCTIIINNFICRLPPLHRLTYAKSHKYK